MSLVLGGIGLSASALYLGLRDRFETLAALQAPPTLAKVGAGEAPAMPTYALESEKGELRYLDRGRSHLYELTLETGEYLHLVAEQDGIDVELRITLPGGEELPPVDSPTGTAREENAFLVSPAAGVCRIEVFGGGNPRNPPLGRYRLRVVERRPATSEDQRHAVAERLFYQANQVALKDKTAAVAVAVELFLQADRIWEDLKNPARQSDALRSAGRIRKEMREYVSAIGLFERALDCCRKAEDSFCQLEALSEIGKSFFNGEDFTQAERAHQEAVQLARDVHDLRGEGSALTNLGNVFEHRGEWGRARDHYERALAIWRTLGDGGEQITDLIGLGFIERSIGDKDRAHELYLEALNLCRFEAEFSPKACAIANTGFAEVYLLSNEPHRAERYLAVSLELRRKVGDLRGIAVSQITLGRARLLTGRPEAALADFRAAREIFREYDDRRGQSVAWTFIGQTHRHMGDPNQAEQALHQAQTLAEESEFPAGIASALSGLSRTATLRGDPLGAVRHAKDAVERIEALRDNNGPPDFESFFEDSRTYYDILIEALMALHRIEPGKGHATQALVMSERARARALLESLTPSGDPELTSVVTGGRRMERELAPSRALTLQGIQRQLVDGVALLEYHLLEERSFVWQVHHGAVQFFEIASAEEIAEMAEDLLDAVRRRQPRARDAAEKLSRAIIPSGLILPGMDRIAVVLDGALQGVPFGLLIDPEPEPSWGKKAKVDWPQPLLWKREIVQLPSVAVLAVLRRLSANRQPASGLIASLADPAFDRRDERVVRREAVDCEPPPELWRRLTASYDEQKAIESLIPDGATSLLLKSFDVRLELVDSGSLDNFRILHFSTHAFDKGPNGEPPGIVFSLVDQNGCGREGILSLEDLHRKPHFFRAELVVLSACETGLGRDVQGEGFVGLAHGFLSTGVPRVVASLWSVDDDASTDLMRRFYRELFQEGRSPAAALATAQREMLESAQWNDPYHWGGFVLQGDWTWEEPSKSH